MNDILICPHCSSDLTQEDYEAGMCPYCGTRLSRLEMKDTPAAADTDTEDRPEEVEWKIDGEWAVCPRCGQSYDLADAPEYCERCVPDPDHAKYRYVYPKPDRPAVQVVLVHDGDNEEVCCRAGQTILGRSVTRGLGGNRYVGRRHARITCSDAACTICDLGSVNGTRVNGRRIDPYVETLLKSGDVVELDIERFVVR